MSVADILPPSPPTTNSRQQKHCLTFPKPITDTPDDSPASFPPSGGDASRKKVEFSPWTTSISDILNLKPNTTSAALLKDLPPSKDCQPTTRPILKAAAAVDPRLGLDGQQDESCPIEKMESLLRQLFENDRLSSIDAYQTMTALIKVYDEPLEEAVLKAKMGALQKYVKRDLVVLDEPAETMPNEERLLMQNLVMSALKVLVTMVWSSSFSPYLTDDFRAWTLERSIQVLREHSLPKASLLHYIHLLATQNFRPNIMIANNRAARLLEVSQELTKHVTGKAILSERLLVYQKLIEQAKPLMKSKAALWIRDVLTAMTHSFKEVRNNAISVATRIYITFPASPSIANAVRSILSQSAGDRTTSASLTNRLERIIAAKDDAVQVPQVWALVLLLCNSTESPIDSWPELMDWLRLIQRCFNCSDLAVRLQGFLAWKRFTYIARPHEASDKMVSMLAKPVVAQLDRTGNSVSGKGSRPAAVSSFCTLLYYAFRPTATHKQITRAWNEYIVKVMTSDFLSKSALNCDLSCRVLIELFWNTGSSTKVWSENRAHENAQLDPKEVPTIDCKWIRSKASGILEVFRILVKHSSFGFVSHQSDQAFVAQAWRSFLKAIRESASKEIKQSLETKTALKNILNFLDQCQLDDAVDAKLTTKTQGPAGSRGKLLCTITFFEMGPLTIIEALEASSLPRSTLVLGETLKLLNGSAGPHGLSLSTTTQQMCADRGLIMLNEELLAAYTTAAEQLSVENISSLLEITVSTLRSFANETVLLSLKILQPALSMLIRDDKKAFAELPESSLALQLHNKLCTSAIDQLARIQLHEFEYLDNLLASLLIGSNKVGTNYILEAWNRTLWQEDSGSYGPSLVKAIEEVQSQASVNLPGILTRSVSEHNSLPEFQQDIDTDFDMHISTTASNILAEISTKVAQKEVGEINEPKTRGYNSSSSAQRSTTSTPQRRLRHDDSQIQFIPVISSPPEADIESQLMTDRQKEVREKQRSEPAVTFADIMSSPRPQSRSSKSAECEISRKAAAHQEAPATPTLPRGASTTDLNDPPTPTPKARQHVSRNPPPDVPSSPASVQESSEAYLQDITSSPLKEINETADDIQLNDEPRILTDGSQLSTSKAAEACVTAIGFSKETPNEEVVQHENVKTKDHEFEAITSTIDNQSGKVAETLDIRNVNNDLASPNGSFSDEIDAMAAFQLSQDLNIHNSYEIDMEDSPRTARSSPRPRKRQTPLDDLLGGHDSPRKRRQTEREVTADSQPPNAPLGERSLKLPDAGQVGSIYESSSAPPTSAGVGRQTRSQLRKNPQKPIMIRFKRAALPISESQSSLPIEQLQAPICTSEARIEEARPFGSISVSPSVKFDTPKRGDRMTKDLTASLQQILDTMDTYQGKDLDLSAIHSLCFKIGLKAQGLVQAREQTPA